jgi:hypothetical protein
MMSFLSAYGGECFEHTVVLIAHFRYGERRENCAAQQSLIALGVSIP